MSGDEERLAELEEKADAIRRRRAELNSEAERWKNERDRLNESVKTLRAEAMKHREDRDGANRRVAELKKRIESLRNVLTEKHRRLTEVDAGLEEGRRLLPPRRDAKEQLRRIEWEMMTTPTADILDREEALIEEARRLKKTLAAHDELDAREDERLSVLADIKATELGIRGCRDEIARLHENSEANHEKMILLHRGADEERSRADEAHAKFLEHLSAIREVDAELDKVLVEARGMRKRLRELKQRSAAERERKVEAMKRKLMMEAKRKLEAGKRLSLDELKLLYGEEEEPE